MRLAGTVRDVAVVHVQQEVDVAKAVANSEMLQEIASAEESMSQEYAAKTGERVRMVQELQAKLAALDHHLTVCIIIMPLLSQSVCAYAAVIIHIEIACTALCI